MNPETIPKKENFLKEIVKFTLIALAIVVPIRTYVAQPFIVSGASMDPTFQSGEYLIVDQLTYHFSDPQREDVIIFRYPRSPSTFFIKRIIGLPGETVDVKNNVVTITNKEHPDGFQLSQPYIVNQSKTTNHFELKDDEYFVMGDNRSASSDSRYWGAVPRNLLIGKAFLRLLPINKAGVWPGQYTQIGS